MDDIEYTISGDASDLVAALQSASEAVEEALDKIKESTQSAGESLDKDLGEGATKAKEKTKELEEEAINLGKSLDEIKEKFHAAFELTGIAAVYEIIEKVVDAFAEAGEKAAHIVDQSELLELTTSQYQALAEAAEKTGTSIGVVDRVALRLQKTQEEAVKSNGEARDALIKMGLSAEQATTAHLELNEILMAVSSALRNSNTATDASNELREKMGVLGAKAASALKAYHGSEEAVKETMIELNALDTQQLKDLQAISIEYETLKTKGANMWMGFIVGSAHAIEWIGTAEAKYGEFGDLTENLGKKSGEHSKESSDELTEIVISDSAKRILAQRKETAENLELDKAALESSKEGSLTRVNLAREVVEETAAIYDSAGGKLSEESKKALQEASKAVEAYSRKQVEDAKVTADSVAEEQEKITTSALQSAEKLLDIRNSQKQIDPSQYAEEEIALTLQIRDAEIQLYTAKKNALVDTGENEAQNAAARRSLEAQIVTSAVNAADKVAEIRNKETDELKKQLSEQLKTRLDAAKNTEDIALGEADAALKILATQQKSGKDPSSVAAAQAIVIQNQLAAQTAYNQATIDMYDQQRQHGIIDLNEYNDAVQRVTNQQTQQNQKAAIQIEQYHQQAADQVKKAWASIDQPLISGLDSAFKGMLQNTESFRSSMRNLFLGLGDDLITGAFHKIVSSWIEGEAQKLAASQSMAGILNALHLQSLIATKAADASIGIGDITTKAAQAAAGAYASTVAIPVFGPALAPAAAAQADAAVMAFASQISVNAAEGGMMVDRDQLAMIHQNEMVLPADIRKGIETKILGSGNGGDSSSTNHFSINSMDAKSFEKYLSNAKNRNVVANAVNTARMRGNTNVRRF